MPERQAILTAIAGKGIERGLDPSVHEDFVMLRYPEDGISEREDNLHKQSIRSLVSRLSPDYMTHISSLEGGFSVEVRRKNESPVIDLDTTTRLREIAAELVVMADRVNA